MKEQRLRFRYRLSAAAASLGHRDITYAWEAAVKAAGLPIAYSSGKRPSPQIALAAPLPQGATSDAEIVDIFLESRVNPESALEAIAPHLPDGITACGVREVGVSAPAVQASLRWAEWEVTVPRDGRTDADVIAAIKRVLALDTLPAEYRREKKVREYDLRPLILDIALGGQTEESFILCMRLRAEQDNTARADQTVLALGLPMPTQVHRTRLEVDDTYAVLQAYHRERL